MRGRLRIAVMLATAAALTGVAIAGWGVGALKSLELSSIDKRFHIRGTQSQPRDVVVVGIDPATRQHFRNTRWPYPRRWHAQVIDRLREAGAKVILFDVQFSEQTTVADDNALIEAVARAGNLVLATEDLKDGVPNVFGADAALLSDIHARGAHSRVPNDADGRVRRIYFQQSGLETLPVVAAERFTGHAVSADDFPGNHAWIDFAGPEGTVRTVSYWKVRDGLVPASTFKGKVVVVGATDDILHDRQLTPTSGGTPMPGPEIQANAVQTILDGFPLKGLGRVGDLALIVLLGLLPALVNLLLRPLRAVLVSIAIGVVFAVLVQLVFDAGLITTFTYPLLALLLSSIGALAVNFLIEAFERARTRDVFARFVSESVADQVLQGNSGISLGGVRRRCTVMFSDLRGFTSFSEPLEPEVVVGLLNRYLTAMSDAILDHGGTLVAYMGDGIFAVFGAPVAAPDHADRALAAARAMFRALDEFNDWMNEQGHDHRFKMGIGLNTGPVMSGHVGSERRLEYAAIGDTTNTAARLEGMTKGTPYQLFVAESTLSMLAEPATDLEFVDEFEVRGKQTTIKVWGLLEDDAPQKLRAEDPNSTEAAL